MKSLKLLLLLLVLFSCQKEEVEIFEKGKQENGFCKAKKNGKKWEASTDAFFFKNENLLYISVNTYSEDASPRELLVLSSTLSIGKTVLKNEELTGYLRLEADGDLSISLYDLDTEEENYIEIEKFNTEEKTAEGSFCLHFKKNTGPESYPAKVRFTKGCFEVKYKEL